jgi:hypothetical protein
MSSLLVNRREWAATVAAAWTAALHFAPRPLRAQARGPGSAADEPRLFPVPSPDGRRQGLIDRTGKLVLEPWYQRIEPFSEGLAAVWNEGKAGYVNAQAQFAVPLEYDHCAEFREGIGICRQESRYFLFDQRGQLIAETGLRVLGSFHSGLVRVQKITQDAEGRRRTYYGFLNRLGQVAIEPQYINVTEFPDDGIGLAVAFPPKESVAHFIDRAGKVIFSIPDPVSSRNWGTYVEGLAKFKKEGYWGFRNHHGEWAVPAKYDSVEDFRFGRARVWVDGKAREVDAQGREYPVNSLYQLQSTYSEGLALATVEGRLTYVNERGEAAFRIPIVERAFPFSNGMARIRLDGRWGFINHSGEMVIRCELLDAEDFRGGLAAVTTPDRKFAYIDTTGKRVFEREIIRGK